MAHEREIVEARRFLSRIGVWPRERQLHIDAWLLNFSEGTDRDVAYALLDAFVHINDDHRVAALRSAIRSLSTLDLFYGAPDRAAAWRDFVKSAIASIPLSHPGDGAASGYLYLRTARAFGFTRCLDSAYLVEDLLKSAVPRPVIFMDDIAGTGRQFIANWKRNYTSPAGKSSLKKLAADGRVGPCFFTPIVATEPAAARIEQETGVYVRPAYLVGPDYFASTPNSRLVPDALGPHLVDVATRYSAATNLDAEGPLGYKQQGLAVSFADAAPNNTLPILRPAGTATTWKPLITND